MNRKHEQTAKQFCEALRAIAGKPENLKNLEKLFILPLRRMDE